MTDEWNTYEDAAKMSDWYRAEMLRYEAKYERTLQVLKRMKRGECFCDFGNGDPRMSAHSQTCIEAMQLLKECK